MFLPDTENIPLMLPIPQNIVLDLNNVMLVWICFLISFWLETRLRPLQSDEFILS
jgi:hypothetical protein